MLHPAETYLNDPCSEERWRLNRCYVSYRPLPTAPPVESPPCLKKKTITFGSFNQSRKITPRTALHWMAVLNAIPNSNLLLKSKNLGEQVERDRVTMLFQEMGLPPERLELRATARPWKSTSLLITMWTSPWTPSLTPAAPPLLMLYGWAYQY